MPEIIKQMFIVLLLLCFGGSLAIKCVFLYNQSCFIRPLLIDLNLDELYYYPFTITVNRCDGNCTRVEGSFGRICVPNKMKDVNLKVFNMTSGIN